MVGVNRGIGVFLWDTASFAAEEYAGFGVEMGNDSATAPVGTATAASAGFSATAMAGAGGGASALVISNGPVDTGLVDTS